MNEVTKLLVDADAFVALNDQHDSNHERAVKLSTIITAQAIDILTSDPAFGEAITVISQHVGLNKAVDFAEGLLASQIDIVEVDARLRKEAFEIFKKQTSKNSRFTDCINMAVMREKGLTIIFSFDEQYKKNKFKRFGID